MRTLEIERAEIAVIERSLSSPGPDDLGLRLVEAKDVLRDRQALLSQDQVRHPSAAERTCRDCGSQRFLHDYCHRKVDTCRPDHFVAVRYGRLERAAVDRRPSNHATGGKDGKPLGWRWNGQAGVINCAILRPDRIAGVRVFLKQPRPPEVEVGSCDAIEEGEAEFTIIHARCSTYDRLANCSSVNP